MGPRLEHRLAHIAFYNKDIKLSYEVMKATSINQEIMHTFLLEKYCQSKKWVIIMDKKQDSIATLTSAGNSGPLAQDCYCARVL